MTFYEPYAVITVCPEWFPRHSDASVEYGKCQPHVYLSPLTRAIPLEFHKKSYVREKIKFPCYRNSSLLASWCILSIQCMRMWRRNSHVSITPRYAKCMYAQHPTHNRRAVNAPRLPV